MSDSARLLKENTSAPVRWRWIACVLIAGVASAAAVLSYHMGDWPWNFHWLDGNKPDSLLLSVAEESRNHLTGIGIVGLLVSTWLLLRKRSSINEVKLRSDLLIDVGAEPAKIARDVSAAVAENGVDVLLEPVDSEEPCEKLCDEYLRKHLDEEIRNTNAMQAAIKSNKYAKLKAENEKLKEQIVSAELAKSSFLSTVSHELRTPMNGIIGMSELLQAANIAPREAGYVNTIHSSANSLMHSLSDILDYTRLSSGDLTLEMSRFNLPECIEDVCEMLADSAFKRGNELVCEVADDVPIMVDGDHNRLRQILNHIISNAIAFTENGDVVIRLSVESEKDSLHTICCEISDTGVGIAPEKQIDLFEAFAQVDDSITRGHEGLGLGLAVSSQLVKAMNGEMSFTSRLGEGTKFQFTMELNEILGEASTDKKPMLHGAKVLLVDDNDTNRTILNHQMSRWGVVTVGAASGAEALECLKTAGDNGDEFDAIILDMHMPEMDGLTLARAIRADESLPNPKIMLLTSAVVDETPEQLAEIGIEKFISKPARQGLLRTSLLSLMPMAFKRNAKEYSEATGSFSYIPVNASVLLVEDNWVSQDVTVSLLESFGCTVQVVEDGESAIDVCTENDFDIVFMDCELPGVSGFDATAAIRKIPSARSSVKIVAVTALAMAGDREKCLASGMNDYLSKPLNQDQLYATLMRWCASKLVVSDEPDALGPYEQYEVESDVRDGFITSQPMESLEVINTDALDAIMGLQRPGKEDLLTKVVQMYLEKTPTLIDVITSSQEDSHIAELNAAAHTLKSSSAYVGAEQLANLCKQIESSVAAKDNEQVSDLSSNLPGAFTEAKAQLELYLTQSAKAA